MTVTAPTPPEAAMTVTAPPELPTAASVAERVFTATVGGLEALAVYLGDRLGYYRALAEHGPSTAEELAHRTGTAERYAREWLEQQAVSGYLVLDDSTAPSRFVLPAGAAEALTDPESLAYLGPLPRMLAAVGKVLPELLDAYRTGDGVSWDELGEDAREAQADVNRPWFLSALPAALAGCPEVHHVLRRPGARILDVGCGAGWSSVALARAYPLAEVVGVDVDAPSVEMARRHAAGSGVGDRLRFRVADGGSLDEEGSYDAAFFFECLHDMPRPVEVLAAVRRSVRPDGLVVVMDEAVGETLVAPGDDLERFMYGCSLFICLPDGMSSAPSAGTGTVMRPPVLRRYAQQAGFADARTLPIEEFGFFRFYRLA